MTFFQAREKARTGMFVRRNTWTDKWFTLWRGIWWRLDATHSRIVQATDYTPADLRAGDWTAIPEALASSPLAPAPPPILPGGDWGPHDPPVVTGHRISVRVRLDLEGTCEPFTPGDDGPENPGGPISLHFDRTFHFPFKRVSDPSTLTTLEYTKFRTSDRTQIASLEQEESAADGSPGDGGLSGTNLVKLGDDTIGAQAGVVHAPDGNHTFYIRPRVILLTPHDWTVTESFPLQYMVDWSDTTWGTIPETVWHYYLQQYGPDGWDFGDIAHSPNYGDPFEVTQPALSEMNGTFPIRRCLKSTTQLPPGLHVTVTTSL